MRHPAHLVAAAVVCGYIAYHPRPERLERWHVHRHDCEEQLDAGDDGVDGERGRGFAVAHLAPGEDPEGGGQDRSETRGKDGENGEAAFCGHAEGPDYRHGEYEDVKVHDQVLRMSGRVQGFEMDSKREREKDLRERRETKRSRQVTCT